ncbi:MAG: metal ABC transporter substrate-binding protein [Lachnospiraceae bacterium]|nr:metal ABC transporter substrate-binding protein [Lachnospiraceae bacterium]
MKKVLSLFIAAIMVVGGLCACSSGNNEAAEGNDKIQIVTTIFPEYDWVMSVLGGNPADAEVTMLLDSGVDLHSYQPTADDILKISACDLFIYVGGESDEWVEDALAEAKNKDMVVINLLEVLGDSVKEEEVVEGMQEEDHDHEEGEEHDEEEEDHDHEEGEEHDDHDHGEVEYDEHVWLSLRNAAALVQNISDSIQSIDPDNAEVYRNNTSAYIEKLNSLDEEYKTAIQNASFQTILFGDRFPFRYLVDDYGLDYYAAFVGCSAETEASFETIMYLAQKVDELGLPTVMTIEGTDHRIAETIVQNTQTKDQQILTMDSMQGTTSRDVQNGTTYLSVMERNMSVLTDALN